MCTYVHTCIFATYSFVLVMMTFCITKIDTSPVDLPTISPTQTIDLSAVSAKNHPPVSFSYMYIYVAMCTNINLSFT